METYQPIINQLVDAIYSNLVNIIINNEFSRNPRRSLRAWPACTRSRGYFRGAGSTRTRPAVSVNFARAGTFPCTSATMALNYVLNAQNVRQDHISINRATDNADKSWVVTSQGTRWWQRKRCNRAFPGPNGGNRRHHRFSGRYLQERIQGPAKKYMRSTL